MHPGHGTDVTDAVELAIITERQRGSRCLCKHEFILVIGFLFIQIWVPSRTFASVAFAGAAACAAIHEYEYFSSSC